MNVSLKPSKLLILLVASSLAWIGVLTLAAVELFGIEVSTGWIIAGAMMLGLVAMVLVIFKEVRRAIELPDYLAEAELARHGAFRLRFSRSNSPEIRGMTAGSYDRMMPRRVRARRSRPRTASWN